MLNFNYNNKEAIKFNKDNYNVYFMDSIICQQ